MENIKISVEVKCSGFGTAYFETVEITKEDIIQLACDKQREVDASQSITGVKVKINSWI